MRRPLLLTGGPGSGKTTTGRALAESAERCAFVDADDVRQLVVAGAAAPWDGAEGEWQRELGARNCAILADSFGAAGLECVTADVLTPRGLAIWREAVPDVLVVRLILSADAALARLGGRHPFITDDELRWLHAAEQRDPPAADAVLDVEPLTAEQQLAAVARLWR